MPHLHRLAGVVIVCAALFGVFGLGDPVEEDVRAVRAGAMAGPRSTATPIPPSGSTAADRRSPVPTAPPATASARPGPAAPAARWAKADELGQVPILMYHRIVAKPTTSLDRTPRQLRAELTRLAREGYVPITAVEFVDGRIDIPAGRHPVVLTFDDGTPGHFSLDERGVPRPETAVGVLLEVAAAHPGFRPVATFYVNREPFALGARAAEGMRWLTAHGFEVANHTATHADLSQLSRTAVQAEIDKVETEILALTGAHSTTFAYPYGAIPAKATWVRSHAGHYSFKGIFLAGWRPSVAPFDRSFDPFEIMRIRSAGLIAENDCKKYCSSAWLDWLGDHPDQRYTSDGDAGVITFPAARLASLGAEFRDRARTY